MYVHFSVLSFWMSCAQNLNGLHLAADHSSVPVPASCPKTAEIGFPNGNNGCRKWMDEDNELMVVTIMGAMGFRKEILGDHNAFLPFYYVKMTSSYWHWNRYWTKHLQRLDHSRLYKDSTYVLDVKIGASWFSCWCKPRLACLGICQTALSFYKPRWISQFGGWKLTKLYACRNQVKVVAQVIME